MTNITREAVERTICNPIINYVHDGRHPSEAKWGAIIDMARALRDELDRVEAERDAAWDAAIEAAAYMARNACLVPPDGGSPTQEEVDVCDEADRRIRALKRGEDVSDG